MKTVRQQSWNRPDQVAGGAHTVGQHLSRGFSLVEIWCLPCHRMEHIAVHDLPLHLRIGELWRRHRCSECGGQDLASRVSVSEMKAFWSVGMLDGRTPL